MWGGGVWLDGIVRDSWWSISGKSPGNCLNHMISVSPAHAYGHFVWTGGNEYSPRQAYVNCIGAHLCRHRVCYMLLSTTSQNHWISLISEIPPSKMRTHLWESCGVGPHAHGWLLLTKIRAIWNVIIILQFIPFLMIYVYAFAPSGPSGRCHPANHLLCTLMPKNWLLVWGGDIWPLVMQLGFWLL